MDSPRTNYEHIATKTNDTIVERRTCIHSGEEFPIYQKDLDLLEKLSPAIWETQTHLPLPVIAPRVRKLISLMFKNERHLYKDTCWLTGKNLISRIAPEMWRTVYSMEARASDDRDYTSYAQEITSDIDVFHTIQKLTKITPYQNMIWSLSNVANNSQYTNYTADLSNCYLLFDANTTSDSAYITKSRKSSASFDCLNIKSCEHCYECIDCSDMYQSFFCYDSSWCTDCSYLIDCHGCDHCIWCSNLQNVSYHIFNNPVSKEEYKATLEKLQKNNYAIYRDSREEIQKKTIRKATHIQQSEKSIGENIRSSKEIFLSSNIRDSESLRYCFDIISSQDCMDVISYGHTSFKLYMCSQTGRFSNNLFFCAVVWKWENLLYCIDTKKSKNCFWCVNIKQKEYCIFNKQYTKEQYEQIVPKLIARMKQQWQRWSFFPTTHTIYPYNDTVAMDYFQPKEVLSLDGTRLGWYPHGIWTVRLLESDEFICDALYDLWWAQPLAIKRRTSDREVDLPPSAQIVHEATLRAHISELDDSILTKVIVCEQTWRPFRVIKMELDFYRLHQLPLPRLHPDIRHHERMSRRPWSELSLRPCDSSWEMLLSVYPDSFPWRVVSDDVYEREVFG